MDGTWAIKMTMKKKEMVMAMMKKKKKKKKKKKMMVMMMMMMMNQCFPLSMKPPHQLLMPPLLLLLLPQPPVSSFFPLLGNPSLHLEILLLPSRERKNRNSMNHQPFFSPFSLFFEILRTEDMPFSDFLPPIFNQETKNNSKSFFDKKKRCPTLRKDCFQMMREMKDWQKGEWT